MHNDQITTFNRLRPDMVRAIREVFDDAVTELERRRGSGTAPLPEATRAEVARRLVELARHGESDTERLRRAAIDGICG
jgi:hypothetical protein